MNYKSYKEDRGASSKKNHSEAPLSMEIMLKNGTCVNHVATRADEAHSFYNPQQSFFQCYFHGHMNLVHILQYIVILYC